MKIGVIGCGKQSDKHVSGLLKNGVTQIVATDLFEAARERLAGKFDEVTAVADAEAIFADEDVAGVIIATPPGSHFALIERAIATSKPFLVEKPMVPTLEEAETVAKLSSDANVPGMVGYIYRQVSALRDAKAILEGADRADATSPVLGKMTTAFFRLGGRGSAAGWKHQKKTDGGAVSEMLVHMADLAVWYFGAAAKVEIIDRDLRQPTRVIGGETVECDADDHIIARLTMENGLQVIIFADMNTPAFTQYVELQGSNGTLEASIQGFRPNRIFLSEARGGYDAGETKLTAAPADLYIAQGAAFLEMVRSGNEPAQGGVAQAAAVMKIQADLS